MDCESVEACLYAEGCSLSDERERFLAGWPDAEEDQRLDDPGRGEAKAINRRGA